MSNGNVETVCERPKKWRKTGGETGEKGREMYGKREKDGARSGILKVTGSGGKKQEKLCNIAQYFAIEKVQRGGRQQKRAGTGD